MTNSSNPIADALFGAFQAKQEPPRYARVTQVPLDANLRTQGYVVADIDGNSVNVKIGPSDTFYPGDTLMTQRTGSKAAASYISLGFVSGTRPDAGMSEIPADTTVGGVNYGAGDQYLGALTGANWWFKYASGVFAMRQAAVMNGAIGNLNGLYGYAVETWGSAFGQYGSGKVWIATDPTNGFRIANYTTPIFQADTAGVVWALSTFRAGTGNNTVGMSATDATWRLYAGHATPASAPFRVDKAGALTATGATISGALTATSGTIGGWTAATDKLTAGNITLDAGLGRIQLGTGGAELVVNSDFALYTGTQDNGVADTFTGWTFEITAPNRPEATATAYTGHNALKFVRSAASWMDAFQIVTVVPGATYTCVAYVIGAVTLLIVDWSNPGNPTLGTQTGIAGSTYQRIAFSFTAPAGCTQSLIYLIPPSGNGSYYVGSVSLQRTDSAQTDYIRLEPGVIQSNYVPGSTGWRVSAAGDAEFENVTVRGAIKASVFEKGTISAFAGGLIVAKSAGKLAAAYTVGGTLTIETPVTGGWVFDTNDIIRIKAEYTTGLGDTWITVTRTATENVYTTTYQSGTNSIIYPAGTACVDYGVSGQGYFAVAADGTFGASAAWVLRSHAGAPWTTETTHVYAGTDGKLYAGAGNVLLDTDGVSIISGAGDPNLLKFVSGTTRIAYINAVNLGGGENTLYLTVNSTAGKNGRMSLTATELGGNSAGFSINSGVSGASSSNIIMSGVSVQVQQSFVANDLGGDFDTRIEGDTDANLFFVDASTDRIGIGNNAPAEKLHITGNVQYTGTLKPYRNSTTYDGSVFVPLTTPLTSTSWDGDAYSTTAKTVIDLSAVFSAPAGIKAALLRVVCRDSASATTANLYVALSPNDTAGSAPAFCRVSGLPNDYLVDQDAVVPCNADGDIYYQIEASGAGTMDVYLQIWGYWI